MTDQVASAALSLGFTLGVRHALDADHLAAISTLVSESRNVWRSSLVGTWWGLGHTAALMAAGIAVVGLKLTIPASVAHSMETAVAVMLILLGARAVHTAWRFHVHGPGADHVHQHRHVLAVGARPFLVGLMHGLAGSAGLMVLVLSTITSVLAAFAFIVVFGLGSTAGMLLMSSLISLPFVWTLGRFRWLLQGLQLVVGCGSILFGCIYGLTR